MAANNVVKQIRVVGVSEGLADLARDVRDVGKAHSETAKSTEAAARVTDTASKRVLSVEGAYNRLMGTLDANTRATQQMERAQRTLDRAFQQSLIDTAQYARAMDMLNAKYDASTIAANRDAQAAAALRAQINPLAVAQGRLNTELAEYTALASRGAINARELASAQALAKSRFDASTASVRAQNTAMNDNVPGRGGNYLPTSNIAAQFQDIGVTAAMGMSPLQIALQQGTQLSAVFNDLKASGQGVGRALFTAFTSIISPVSLLTLGIVAAGAATIQWFMKGVDKAKDFDTAIKLHTESVEHLKVVYGETAEVMRAMENAGTSKVFSKALIAIDTRSLEKQLTTQLNQVWKKVTDDELIREINSEVELGGSDFDTHFGALTLATDTYRDAVSKLLDSIRSGNTDLQGFRNSLLAARNEAVAAGGSVTGLTTEMMGLEKSARQLFGDAESEFSAFQQPLNEFFLGLQEGKKDFDPVLDKIDEIGDANGMEDQARKVFELIGKVMQLNAEIEKTAAAEAAAAKRVADAYRQYANSRIAGPGAKEIMDGLEQQRISREEAVVDAQIKRAQARTDAERIAAAATSAAAEAEESLATAAEKSLAVSRAVRQEQAAINLEIATGLRDRTQARDEDLRTAQEELTLIGKSAAEVAKLQYEYDELAKLRQDAFESGRAIDEAEIAAIQQKAAEIGKVTQARIVDQAQADIAFDRTLIGLRPEEASIRQSLHSLGIEYGSVDGQRLAGEMRYNQQLERTQEQMNKVREIASGMFTDMFSGPMDDMDAFFDKLIDNFARIGQMNLQNAFDQLFGVKGASGGGGFDLGALGKQIGSLFGGGGASKNAPVAVRVVQDTVSTHSYSAGYSSGGGDISSFLRGGQSKSHIEGMSTDFAEALGTMLKAAPEAVRSAVTINSGFRSIARQGQLFDAAVQKYGSEAAARKWVAPPGNSQHNKGNAADLGYSSTAAKEWFHQNASKYGLAFPLGNEDWHVELAGVRGGAAKQADTIKTAMAGLPTAVETGAIAGTETGAKTGIQSGLKGIGSDFASSQASGGVGGIGVPNGAAPAQGGGGMFGGAGMQNLSIGLGAFGMGAQSGNPMMGGLSGAMSGMAGGPIGMLIGGAAGILGGLFGKSRQRKAEQEAAKKALKEQMGAIEDMLDYATGTITGSITGSMREYNDEVGKAIELATKAGDKELASRLKASVGELEARLIKDFSDAYDGTIEGMNLGLGIDNPFKQGFDAVKALRDELLAFVDDAKTAGLAFDAAADSVLSATGKAGSAANSNNLNEYQARDLINRHQRGEDISQYSTATWGLSPFSGDKDNGGPNSVYMEQLFAAREAARAQALAKAKDAADGAAEAERKLSDARKAAVNQALSVLSGAKELTEIEQQMMELRGKVAALGPVLKDLGLGADEATRAIESHLAIAVAKLKDQYIDDVTRSINDLSGMGFMNDIIDAQETYKTRLKDAAAVGLDGSLAMEELNLSIAEIASSASLTDEQLKILAQSFPALASSLMGAIGGQTVADAQAAVERARAALRASYEKEASALQTTVDRMKDFIKSIADFRDSMKLNEQISPLSPYERLMEAQRQFRDVSAQAAAGDEDAMGKLTGISQSYLDEAKSYYGSTLSYMAIWEEVNKTLSRTEDAAKKQLSDAEKQLATLKEQVAKLIDIDEGVKSVADAIADLAKAMSGMNSAISAAAGRASQASNEDIARAYNDSLGRAPDAAGQAYWAGSGKSGDQIRSDIAGSPEAQINKAYRDILGRDMDAASEVYWKSTGKTPEQIRADLEWAKANGSYASGGYTGDAGVNEIAGVVHGQEFVMNAAATARWRPQFEAMNAGRAIATEPSERGGLSKADIGALAQALTVEGRKNKADIIETLENLIEAVKGNKPKAAPPPMKTRAA